MLDVELKTEGSSDDAIGQASKKKNENRSSFCIHLTNPFLLPERNWMLQTVDCPSSMIACVFSLGQYRPAPSNVMENSSFMSESVVTTMPSAYLNTRSSTASLRGLPIILVSTCQCSPTDPRVTKPGGLCDRNDRSVPSDSVSRPPRRNQTPGNSCKITPGIHATVTSSSNINQPL